jgi:lycopene cyclase domain-containing protein
MSYSSLNAIFLGLALWFFVVAFVAIGFQMRRRALARRVGDESAVSRRGRGLIWKYAATLIVLLAFTAVFDNLIVGLGIVAYDPAKISGVFIGVAPIEDFAYSIAAVLILPTLWGVLGHFKRADTAKGQR